MLMGLQVRELHEDQEALQLHARAVRIRQKILGVWNATVAETLFNVRHKKRASWVCFSWRVALFLSTPERVNTLRAPTPLSRSLVEQTLLAKLTLEPLKPQVSLIYKDLEDLASALQCCRGCCRVYGLVLGHDHRETRDADAFLNELSAAHQHRKSALGSLFSLACFATAGGGQESGDGDGGGGGEAHDLSANPRLRMAFRTVLEEV
jgi:hypothetical protein